jgi:hypothetical protein
MLCRLLLLLPVSLCCNTLFWHIRAFLLLLIVGCVCVCVLCPDARPLQPFLLFVHLLSSCTLKVPFCCRCPATAWPGHLQHTREDCICATGYCCLGAGLCRLMAPVSYELACPLLCPSWQYTTAWHTKPPSCQQSPAWAAAGVNVHH